MDYTLVLIDSGFLSKLSKYFGGGIYLKYDLISFCENLAKKQNLNCKHIYFYTAPPFQSEIPTKEELEKYKRYKKFTHKLSKFKIITIREGRCQRLKDNGKFAYGQKGVDALIIIDLMSIPLEHKDIKKVILIANDSDFVPVIEKIEQLGIRIILHTHYSKKRQSSFSRSNELLKVVSKYTELKKEDFDSSPLEKKEKK